MSFTSESEEVMAERGYRLEVVDGINVFIRVDGLAFDSDSIIDYEIQPWMSKCATRGIRVEKEYAKKIAIRNGDMAE